MCRLYGFRATEPTKVECSLVLGQNALLMQSWSDMQGKRHADGWGIGYFDHGQPRLRRRKTAAFEDSRFSLAASRVYARTVLAHVRLATVGSPALVNTHPFAYGSWIFAHNGTVQGFDILKGHIDNETDADLMTARLGTTDSEAIFYWLLSRMRRAGINLLRPCPSLADLERLVAAAITDLARRSAEASPAKPPKLNILLTDGTVLLASTWNHRLHWVAREGIRDCELCGIPHVRHEAGNPYRAVVVASEPISQETWHELDNYSLLSIDEMVQMRVRSLAEFALAR